jgi:hypothetical protein
MPIDLMIDLQTAQPGKGINYNYDASSIFTNVPELVEFIRSIGLDQDAVLPGVNISPPRFMSPVHIDPLQFSVYSLNIPIANCDNTFMYYYKSNTPGVYGNYRTASNPLYYTKFRNSDCELLGNVETNEPYLVDLRTPHQFVNKNTDITRYMLLCRIKVSDQKANTIAESIFDIDSA